jgi:hypothetical protein
MKTKLILLSFTVFSFLHLGCGGLTKKREQAELSKIKKVAIVAFMVTQPDSAQISLTNGKLGAESGGSILAQNSEHSERIFDSMSAEIQKNLKWKVLNKSEMISQAGYQKAYDKTMKGWQNKMPAGQGQIQFVVKNVMDKDSLRILGDKGREQLIDDLGVDAIISAETRVSLSGTIVMGVGNRYPKSQVTMFVYGRGQANPIWFETFDGEPSTVSVGKTAFFDTDKLKEQSVISARSAFSKIK